MVLSQNLCKINNLRDLFIKFNDYLTLHFYFESMIKFINTVLIIALVSFLFACKKPAGTGGNSTIKGTIWVYDYDKNMNVLQYQYVGVDVEVYIIYGDEAVEGDKVNTNSKGEFEFNYLRKGNYTIYAVSKEKIGTSNDSKDVAVSVETTITKNKSTVDVGQININQ